MRQSRWNRPIAALAGAGLAVAMVAVPDSPATAAGQVAGPVLELAAAQHSITLDSFGGQVFLDPGIWVEVLTSPLQFDVRRVSYARPFTITQIIHTPGGGTVRRPLPASVVQWNGGLRRFLTLTARNSAGKVAASQKIPFCPDTYDPERVSPSGPATTPFPPQCDTNPFMKGMVWGVQTGWATDPAESNFLGHQVKLALGTYHVTAAIRPVYRRMFGISARDATATVTVKVIKGPSAARSLGAVHRPRRTCITPRGHRRLRRVYGPQQSHPSLRCRTWWRCRPGASRPATRPRPRPTTSRSAPRYGWAATARSTSKDSARTARRS